MAPPDHPSRVPAALAAGARPADPPEHVPWSWLDAFVAWSTSLGLFLFLSVPLAGLAGSGDAQFVWGTLGYALVSAIAVGGYLVARFGRSARQVTGPRAPTWRDAALGAGHGVVAFVVLNIGLGTLLELAARAAGIELPAVQEAYRLAIADPGRAPYLVVSAVVAAPLAEELFFRGTLFQSLRGRWGVPAAVAVSALLWGLVHLEALAALTIVPLGVYLALLFQRRGTLLAPVVMHGVFNLLGVAALVFAPDIGL